MGFARASSAVLIVNDSSDRPRWTAAFEGAGFKTQEAAEATEAFAMLRSCPGIDLLVTTLLQDGSGMQLVADAVQLRPDLRVIIIAYEGYPVGFQDSRSAILLEPVSDTELLDTAHILLSLSQ